MNFYTNSVVQAQFKNEFQSVNKLLLLSLLYARGAIILDLRWI